METMCLNADFETSLVSRSQVGILSINEPTEACLGAEAGILLIVTNIYLMSGRILLLG